MTRRVLVTGAGGLLGSVLVKAWEDRYAVVAASRSRMLQGAMGWVGDLAEAGAAADVMSHAKPQLVVHAAACTDVDACESDPALALRVNAETTGRLAAAARKAGAAFVYISTEAVFDGQRGGYRETDATNPINQYAISKLAGEREALASHPKAIVLRIGLEGWRCTGRPAFVQWVVEGLRAGERRTICTDWRHTLIFAGNVADVIERLLNCGRAWGQVLHAGADRPASNWEIAQAAAATYGLDASLLVPITSDTLRLGAPRPKDTSMVSDKLRALIGPAVWELSDGLSRMYRQERSGELAELYRLVGA